MADRIGGFRVLGKASHGWWFAHVTEWNPEEGQAMLYIGLEHGAGMLGRPIVLSVGAAEAMRQALNDWHRRGLTPAQALAE